MVAVTMTACEWRVYTKDYGNVAQGRTEGAKTSLILSTVLSLKKSILHDMSTLKP